MLSSTCSILKYTFAVFCFTVNGAAFQMHAPFFQGPVIPGQRVSVKDLGAKGDARAVHDGVMNSGASVLRSATAAFSARDVNRAVYVLGAGPAGSPLDTRISSVTNPTQAVLANSAAMAVYDASVVVGDDDSASIQNAIATAGRRGGGTVFLPPGLYRLARPLLIEYSNVRLTGSGTSTALLESNLVTYPTEQKGAAHLEGGWGPFRAITIGKLHQVVSNVEIDSFQIASNGDQWIVSSIGQSLIETSPINGYTVERFRLHDVTFTSSNFGLFSNGGILSGFSLDHNTMTEVPKEGFYVAGLPSNGVISDNHISTTIHPSGSNIAIALKNGNNMKIDGNTISGNFYSCIMAVEFPETDVVVENNTCSLGNTSNVGDGIAFDHGKNIVVSNNVVQGHRLFGITFRGSDADISNVKIINNKVLNGKGGAAISIVGSSNDGSNGPANMTVANNTLSENDSGIQAYGVKGQTVIKGNTITASNQRKGSAFGIKPDPNAVLDCSANKTANYKTAGQPCH